MALLPRIFKPILSGKTLLPLLLGLMLALSLSWPAGAAAFKMKRGVNMEIWTTWPDESRWSDESVLLPYPEWRKSMSEQDLVAIRKAGFDFVRVTVDPAPLLSEKTAAFRGKLYDSILESVRLVNKAGLKAVVDLHLFPTERSVSMTNVVSDPALFERYLQTVRTMGHLLSKQAPDQVAFELMNEPVIDCEAASSPRWPKMLKQLFAAARSPAPKLTLVLSGACWGNADALARIDPREIADDNIIWSFHTYEPFLLTHQGALWAGDFVRYVTGIAYPPYSVSPAEQEKVLEEIRQRIKDDAPLWRRAGMLAYLDEQYAEIDTPEKLAKVIEAPFKTVDAWAKKYNVPKANIFLGEFGMIRQEYQNPYRMPTAWRAAYLHDITALSERYGYAWAVWCLGGATFGITTDDTGYKLDPELLEAMGLKPTK